MTRTQVIHSLKLLGGDVIQFILSGERGIRVTGSKVVCVCVSCVSVCVSICLSQCVSMCVTIVCRSGSYLAVAFMCPHWAATGLVHTENGKVPQGLLKAGAGEERESKKPKARPPVEK